MKYQKINQKNYNLYLIPTTKFKTITISLNLRREDTKEDVVYRRLLRKMLLAGTADYKTLKEYNKAKINIYNPEINIQTSLYGKDRTIELIGQFPNEKYTEKGMNEQNIKFILQTLYNPKIDGNKFNKETFEIIKHEYIEELKAIKDNPPRYTKERLFEEMNSKQYEELKVDQKINLAKTITEKDLYDYYKTIFQDSLDIFIVGNISKTEIEKIITKYIKGNFTKKEKNRPIINPKIKSEPKEIIETSKTNQSNLAIGLKIENMTETEFKYTSSFYTTILGGTWNSKLMQTVREKYSLCYTIFATQDTSFSSIYIFAEIDSKNFEKTYNLIKKQITDMQEGKISKNDIDQVKQLYNNTFVEIEDNQRAMINNLISEVLLNTDSVQTRKENINKITKQDIVNFSKKVHYDIVYLLKGVGQNE